MEDVDAYLGRTDIDHVGRRLKFQPWREGVGGLQRFVELARVDQRVEHAEGGCVNDVREPAGACERHAGAEFVECCLWPLECPQRDPKIVMKDANLVSLSEGGGECDGLPHIVDPLGLSKFSARGAEVAEGAGRPVEAQVVGERERSLSVGDCVGVPALDHFHPRHLCESLDQRGAGGKRFEQRERLGREFGPARVPGVPKCEAQRVHGMGGGGPVIPLFEGVDRVFQCLLCIGGATGVRRGFGKPGERDAIRGAAHWPQNLFVSGFS